MPLLGTRGALSSRGFGLMAGVDGPYWAATLGNSGEQYGRAVAVDTFGNVYAAGYAFFSGTNNVLITKYSIAGTIQWQRTLSGAYTDLALDMATDGSGNVYVTGYVGTGAITQEILITKYDTNGTLQWQRKFGDTASQAGNGVAVDFFGNVYVTGIAQNNNSIVVVKYNTNGILQFSSVFGTSPTTYNEGFGVTIDSSGNIYIVGSTGSVSSGDIYITKLSAVLTIQWQRRLAGASFGSGQGIVLDSTQANLYLVGYVGSDLIVAKYNVSGALQWQRKLSGGFIRGHSIAIDAADKIYVTARSEFLIVSYNSSGTILWQRSFTGGSTDEDPKIAVTPLGAMSLAGTTYSAGAGSSDMLIVRLPGNGTRTGTYGPWTYQAATYTDAAGTLTDSAASLISVGGYLPVDSAAGMTGATSTYTSTVTAI